MNFDDIEMTESFKFEENLIQSQHSDSISQSPSPIYTCYQCGADPSRSSTCRICKGKTTVNNNDPMAIMLMNILKAKIPPKSNHQLTKHSAPIKSVKILKQSCSEIKQEEYPDQNSYDCEVCESSQCRKQKITVKDDDSSKICSVCTTKKKILKQKTEITYTKKKNTEELIENYRFSETYLEVPSKKQVLKDNDLNSTPQFPADSTKYWNFSPTKSRGTVSPNKSNQSSRVKIYCDESDSQQEDKCTEFKLSLNKIEGANYLSLSSSGLLDQQQCVRSSVKISQKCTQMDEDQHLKFQDYFCDECHGIPKRFRYHCKICEDYDLCQSCFDNRENVHEDHNFLKICKVTESSQLEKKQQYIRKTIVNNVLSNYSRR